MKHALSLRLLAVALLTFTLSGCFNTFSVTKENFKPGGKSIAVIGGIDNELNRDLAALIAHGLQKESRFEVRTPQQVARALGTTSPNIKGPYKSAYFEIDLDWTQTDVKKVAALQRSLGVDYLYVLWAPSAINHNGAGTQMDIVAQLFESGGREVGQGKFTLFSAKDDAKTVREGTERVARELAQKTSMARPAK